MRPSASLAAETASPPLDGRVPFVRPLALVWGLRIPTATNRSKSGSAVLPSALGGIVLLTISGALGWGAWHVLSHPGVAASEFWSSFLLRAVCFLVSIIAVAWPILSAGVDEHSELSRFATFPIRPLRLFVASSVSALVEPRALLTYPAVLGAILGYHQWRPFSLGFGGLLVFAYFLLNVACGRAALTLVLNVLRHRRSAEILGLFFIAALFLPVFAPPPDVSWLYDFLQGASGDLSGLNDRILIAQAASLAFATTPPGKLAVGIENLSAGRTGWASLQLAELLFFAGLAFGLSYWLLLRFYRRTARAPAPARQRPPKTLRARSGALWAMLDREASDFWRNPKARLLCAVPFFLCILLRFSSANVLADALCGDAADAWLLFSLCSYAGLVVGANFAQNAFAYDGPGLALLYAAPVDLRTVFVAKNLVHASGALLVGLVLTAFYGVYVHAFGAASAALGLFALAGQVPVLLAAGNLLSVLAPRKFHASLRRRDRPPAVSTLVGMAVAVAAVTPGAMLVRGLGRDAPGSGTLLALAGIAAAAWGLYLFTLPRACALLASRRERVLRMVMRE